MSKISLLFLLTFFSGLITALTVNGVWGFYLYQLVYFLNPGHRWWSANIPDLKYSFTIVVFMMLAFIMQHKECKNNTLFEAPQTKWLIGIIIMFLITQLYAISPEHNMVALIDLTKMFIVMALAYKFIDTPRKFEISLWFFIIGAAYIGWEAYSVGRTGAGRVEGIGTLDAPDANSTAALLVPTIPFLIYFVWQGTLKVKFLTVFFGVWIANALVLINSRGAFLGVLVGAGYFSFMMIFSHFKSYKQRSSALLIIAVSLSGALSLTDDQFWSRMSTLQDVEDEETSGSHRYRMWLATFDVVADYPGGTGAYGYNILSPIYVDEHLFHPGQKTKSVHSTWFQALSELGWLGLFIFCGLLLSSFRVLKQIKTTLKTKGDSTTYFKVASIECGLLGYLTTVTFINQFRAQILYWLIMYTACLANIYLYHEKDKDSKHL